MGKEKDKIQNLDRQCSKLITSILKINLRKSESLEMILKLFKGQLKLTKL